MTIEEKIQELLSNEQAVEGLLNAKTPDELMKALADNNIVLEDVTKEEAFAAFQKANSDEISEDELEAVSGGVNPAVYNGIRVAATVGAVAGAALYIASTAAVAAVAHQVHKSHCHKPHHPHGPRR